MNKNEMVFFFDEKNPIQSVELEKGDYIVEKHDPSIQDIHGFIYLGKGHSSEKIKHPGGMIYVSVGSVNEYALHSWCNPAAIKFMGHGCAKITRLS